MPSTTSSNLPRTKADIETSPDRPRALRSQPERIPAELRDRDQWVCWRFERRNGKWTKLPIDPKTGRAASSTDPETWGTIVQALASYQAGKADGIGFVFAPDDPYAGVDLDDCRDPGTKEIEPWAAQIVAELGSYTEVSPSGTGVKVFLKGKVPAGGNRRGKVEMYDHGRYFTVTGRKVVDTPAGIRRRQRALDQLHTRLFPPPTTNTLATKAPACEKPLDLSDEGIIHKAKTAENGAKFRKLWAGDTSGHRSSSEADLALCGLLAFWIGPDPERIDRLFRQSGLYRGKWERAGYRQGTIAKTLSGRSQFYSPGRNGQGRRRPKTKTIRFTVEL